MPLVRPPSLKLRRVSPEPLVTKSRTNGEGGCEESGSLPAFAAPLSRHWRGFGVALCALRRHCAVGGDRKSQTGLGTVARCADDVRQKSAVGEDVLRTGAVRIDGAGVRVADA